MEEDDDDMRGKMEDLIDFERTVWMRNLDNLYDLVITQRLKTPPLTVEWLPERAGENNWVQNLILGTRTSENEPSYLMLAQFSLEDASEYNDGSYNFAWQNPKVQIIKQINHDGEVNKARYMPQNSCLIATKTVGAEVYVFDYSKHPSKPPLDGACNPDLRLSGHNTGGYGLSWSKFKTGHLLSGSGDAQICHWDINGTPNNKSLNAMQIFKAHDGAVEDIAWHLSDENLFGSCGVDKYVHVWDLRSPLVTKPVQTVMAHQNEVNCLAFNPINEWYLATGSADKTVKLFDLRRLNEAVHTFDKHKVNQEQTLEEAPEDSRPELVFIHGGHTSIVSDFSWNPREEWMMASVAEDNVLQIWHVVENFYRDEDEDETPVEPIYDDEYEIPVEPIYDDEDEIPVEDYL